jgi:RimJ/RimL family protein N-acetyltransferase
MRPAMLHPITLPATDSSLERLIRADAPTRMRAVAVLDGTLVGRAWVDDPTRPRGVLVIEDADGTTYAGGDLTRDAVAATLAGVPTRSGDLIFGFAGPDDPLHDLVPGEPYWRGEAIDLVDRVPPADEETLLRRELEDGAQLVRLDAATLPMTEWYEDTIHAAGSLERWLEAGIGYGVLREGELLAEATAGPRCRGWLELGVITREAHRGHGYGTLVSCAVARACEAGGDRVWWNANADNAPSLAIARRIGFRTERRYELVACRAPRLTG